MIALLVMTDGRDHIFETLPTAEAFLVGPVSEVWIHDDSGDPERGEKLRRVFPHARVVQTAGRSGFGGAIRSAWDALRLGSSAPFVFHLEDDFRLFRIVELARMAEVLQLRPELVQLALRRQPWNAEELAAGGIVELHPGDFEDRTTRLHDGTEAEWLAHRRFFTTNPSLYRTDLLGREWPDGAHSEGRFSIELFASNPDRVAGYWGSRSSGEWCEHIGHQRVGTGY